MPCWKYTVQIPTWLQARDGDQDHVTMFRVDVLLQKQDEDPEVHPNTPFFVLRRYSQFIKLFEELRHEFPMLMNERSLNPPPKYWFTAGYEESRREELEKWMWVVLSHSDLAQALPLRNFLEFDKALAHAYRPGSSYDPHSPLHCHDDSELAMIDLGGPLPSLSLAPPSAAPSVAPSSASLTSAPMSPTISLGPLAAYSLFPVARVSESSGGTALLKERHSTVGLDMRSELPVGLVEQRSEARSRMLDRPDSFRGEGAGQEVMLEVRLAEAMAEIDELEDSKAALQAVVTNLQQRNRNLEHELHLAKGMDMTALEEGLTQVHTQVHTSSCADTSPMVGQMQGEQQQLVQLTITPALSGADGVQDVSGQVVSVHLATSTDRLGELSAEQCSQGEKFTVMLQQRLEQAEQARASLEAALQASEEKWTGEVHRLQADIADLVGELAQVKHQQEQPSNKVQDLLHAELWSASTKHTDVKEVSMLRAELASSQQQLSDLQQAEQQLRAELDSAAAKHAAIEEDLTQQVVDALVKHAEMEEHLRAQIQEMATSSDAALRSELDAAQATAATLKSQLDLTSQQLADLHTQHATLTRQHDTVQTELDHSTLVLAELRTQHEALTSTQQSQQLQLDRKTQELTDLNTQHEHLTSNQHSVQAQLDRVTQELADLHTQHEELSSKHSTLATQHDLLTQDHSRLTQELQNLASEHTMLQTKHSQLVSQHDLASSEYALLVDEHKSLVEAHGALQASHDALAAQHDTHSTAMSSTDAAAAVCALQKELSGLNAKYTSLASEHESLGQDHERLEAESLETEERCQALLSQVSSLMAELSSMKALKVQLESELMMGGGAGGTGTNLMLDSDDMGVHLQPVATEV